MSYFSRFISKLLLIFLFSFIFSITSFSKNNSFDSCVNNEIDEFLDCYDFNKYLHNKLPSCYENMMNNLSNICYLKLDDNQVANQKFKDLVFDCKGYKFNKCVRNDFSKYINYLYDSSSVNSPENEELDDFRKVDSSINKQSEYGDNVSLFFPPNQLQNEPADINFATETTLTSCDERSYIIDSAVLREAYLQYKRVKKTMGQYFVDEIHNKNWEYEKAYNIDSQYSYLISEINVSSVYCDKIEKDLDSFIGDRGIYGIISNNLQRMLDLSLLREIETDFAESDFGAFYENSIFFDECDYHKNCKKNYSEFVSEIDKVSKSLETIEDEMTASEEKHQYVYTEKNIKQLADLTLSLHRSFDVLIESIRNSMENYLLTEMPESCMLFKIDDKDVRSKTIDICQDDNNCSIYYKSYTDETNRVAIDVKKIQKETDISDVLKKYYSNYNQVIQVAKICEKEMHRSVIEEYRQQISFYEFIIKDTDMIDGICESQSCRQKKTDYFGKVSSEKENAEANLHENDLRNFYYENLRIVIKAIIDIRQAGNGYMEEIEKSFNSRIDHMNSLWFLHSMNTRNMAREQCLDNSDNAQCITYCNEYFTQGGAHRIEHTTQNMPRASYNERIRNLFRELDEAKEKNEECMEKINSALWNKVKSLTDFNYPQYIDFNLQQDIKNIFGEELFSSGRPCNLREKYALYNEKYPLTNSSGEEQVKIYFNNIVSIISYLEQDQNTCRSELNNKIYDLYNRVDRYATQIIRRNDLRCLEQSVPSRFEFVQLPSASSTNAGTMHPRSISTDRPDPGIAITAALKCDEYSINEKLKSEYGYYYNDSNRLEKKQLSDCDGISNLANPVAEYNRQLNSHTGFFNNYEQRIQNIDFCIKGSNAGCDYSNIRRDAENAIDGLKTANQRIDNSIQNEYSAANAEYDRESSIDCYSRNYIVLESERRMAVGPSCPNIKGLRKATEEVIEILKYDCDSGPNVNLERGYGDKIIINDAAAPAFKIMGTVHYNNSATDYKDNDRTDFWCVFDLGGRQTGGLSASNFTPRVSADFDISVSAPNCFSVRAKTPDRNIFYEITYGARDSAPVFWENQIYLNDENSNRIIRDVLGY